MYILRWRCLKRRGKRWKKCCKDAHQAKSPQSLHRDCGFWINSVDSWDPMVRGTDFPRSHPRAGSQCPVIRMICDNTCVRDRSITILEESNLAPALRCTPWCGLRCRCVTFALPLLPTGHTSINSVLQLVSCNLLSNRRSSLAIRSISACHPATEIAGRILISEFLAR